MKPITVETNVNASAEKVWDFWNNSEHIPGWAFASQDWEARPVTNELHVGGEFKTRMQAKDGSAGFDFAGTYTVVEPVSRLSYELADGRKVSIEFNETSDGIHIVQSFDPESENPEEMQRAGWQAFLDNFKSYAERA